ncbi:uncharacterized protein LOC134079110 isoform X2 [Sardina pilchardus]|uniref:uncharacterized protein LOC134079110 isoform X2 n=1 Tax=Sardina pilchardus TaxID=27697 RepID=UPI002E1447B6
MRKGGGTCSMMETIQKCALLLWVLMFALARSENEIMTLRSTESVSPHCHGSISLSCNISSLDEPTIFLFAWYAPNGRALCELKNGNISTHNGVNCVYKDQQLVLTIGHTKPTHEGKYLCKLHSNVGAKQSYSQLNIQECLHSLHVHSHDGNSTCHARGVYPEAHIHWFQGSNNLTDSSVAHPRVRSEDGTYEIASTLLHRPHSTPNCSLWSPSSGRYLSSTRRHEKMAYAEEVTGSSKASSYGGAGTSMALLAAALILL